MRQYLRLVVSLVALAVVFSLPVSGQETTGEILGSVTTGDGAPLTGATVRIENPATGHSMTAVTPASGRFRFPTLPPAQYELTAALEGFQTVERPIEVQLGRSTTVDIALVAGTFSGSIEVIGETPLLDLQSTTAGFTAGADELAARLPIDRDPNQVAMLAPGTITPHPSISEGVADKFVVWWSPGQSVPSVAGASAGENTYLVNGLNTTNPFDALGGTFVPMEFVDQVQIKTGGYQAEFGRATGGVVNLVTKSGTNAFRGGLSLYSNPESLQEQEPDTYYIMEDGTIEHEYANSKEHFEDHEANLSLGGPIVRDRLFFFAFLRYTDWDSLDMRSYHNARNSSAADPYWGGKLDWQITAAHRLEGTVLSDETRVENVWYDVDIQTGEVLEPYGESYSLRGGQNWILKYTGVLGPMVVLSVQAGFNPYELTTRSEADDVCPVAIDNREGRWWRIGCWTQWEPTRLKTERQAYRLDLDWVVGRHGVRAGVDAEMNTGIGHVRYSGDIFYRYELNGDEDDPDDLRFPDLPWDQELVRAQYYDRGGPVDSFSNAAYIQDSWLVSPNLTLNFGLRWERFEIENLAGETFMEVNDQLAPRLGVIWDPSGRGRAKLYGSFGIYHTPLTTGAAGTQTGGEWLTDTWYPLEGDILDDGSPEALGEVLRHDVWIDGEVEPTREIVDSDFDPMSQSELILGYERLVGAAWTIGVRAVARRVNDVIENITLDRALWEVYGVECTGPEAISADDDCLFTWVFTNPGSDFSGWYDLDGDGELDPIELTADQLGIPKAERNYLALELSARRRFADGWMLGGSYTLSRLWGNYEGFTGSDGGGRAYTIPYTHWAFDVAAMMEHSSGNLPQDRRHNLKAFGSYAFDFGLQLSASGFFQSGRPINGFGMHPTDPWAWAFTETSYPYSFYNGGEACPRGCGGVTDDVWALDLGVGYTWRWLGADWFARVDARNVFNNDAISIVDEKAEDEDFDPRRNYLQPRYFQRPRSVRFGFGLAF